ncbi:ubiquinone biosynthesis regulatory protein kinase UbiB [Candidatus Albibeggiatoa sp. nov. BB20]|uniref:ubiquinone biosynthesis regulatory protein kinase UbiB n=1 Tax=Candidatus Albibeggiatoa sp. nov. BB20 TaxID=3162723 RepID=UPI003365535F
MLRYFHRFLHLLTIYRVIVRYGLDEMAFTTDILRPLRLLTYLSPGYWLRPKHLSRGARLRLALEELGPIFIKFGQILSTRRDLLDDDISTELAKLQDRVTPFDGELARKMIEQGYGHPLEQIFSEFQTEPMASASIAQVHAARLHDGREVIIKVIRPRIAKRIKKDVELLYFVAELAHKYWSEGKRLRPLEVVAEFEKNLHDELDLMKEAANSTLLRRNFTGSELLYVPEIEWDYTLPNVMVAERISGVPINNVDELKRQQINLKYLAEAGVEIFFTQVFRDNFFHADMHPGNIFVDTHDPEKPSYIAVDFGIMGTLSTEDQHYLAENFLAFFHRDYRRVAELHIRSEWVPADTRIEEFEGAIRSVCEPIFDRPLKDISFGLVLLRLFQTARRFNMEVQPQLVLLQKTLLNIEGVGRQLYPDLDLWQTAKPFLERWMDERVGLRALINGIKTQIPLWAEKMPDLPVLIHENLTQRQSERKQLQKLTTELQLMRTEMQQRQKQQRSLIFGSVLILSSSILFGLQIESISWNMPLIAGLLAILGIILILWDWIRL